ncbi:thioredoxin-2 [Trichomonascus vanleenenianus]|uniref:thioredoxin-2 n=1 Tax=Trichomonascus vanleenenianus TaxID=2268995 RepID=UPI003ECA7A33
MAIQEITSLAQFNEVVKSSKLVVVDFYATWCGPCKTISPFLEKFSEKFADKSEFYKVDVDSVPDLAQEQGISAMPTILFFKNGEKIETVVGANIQAITRNIESNL